MTMMMMTSFDFQQKETQGMFASDEQLTYTQFMYNMQWVFHQDNYDEYFTLSEKEVWLQLLPQVWQGNESSETMRMQDVVRRIGQVFKKEGLVKFVSLLEQTTE